MFMVENHGHHIQYVYVCNKLNQYSMHTAALVHPTLSLALSLRSHKTIKPIYTTTTTTTKCDEK